ncbi:hypothetical protein [Sulfurospirillum deleyianum]|uniref:Cysteine-rich small domain-containing protein n=1 Tax=Sulfurospirillum deleyianum (strain ATCC 51133 / DSM 6946 / 5175) TaxID=525898 RepID=D1B2U6_SULD5|nr:hypothetical protein [Sulfurospirillum deleyianum]ACZ12416.1 conserved hypothetical protein [Sulfurospirillum deleyianum DSM 6946]
MAYFDWFLAHNIKHQEIVKKLTCKGDDKEEIIAYFAYEHMCNAEPQFCPLYESHEKCHTMDNLNCYLCACPYFRFNDLGLKEINGMCVKSECSIHSRKATWFIYENVMHLDCSQCTIPHKTGFIRKHFDLMWKNIMSHSPVKGEAIASILKDR